MYQWRRDILHPHPDASIVILIFHSRIFSKLAPCALFAFHSECVSFSHCIRRSRPSADDRSTHITAAHPSLGMFSLDRPRKSPLSIFVLACAVASVVFVALPQLAGSTVIDDALHALEDVEHLLDGYVEDESSTSLAERMSPGEDDEVEETPVRAPGLL